jgi:hypothetical protein
MAPPTMAPPISPAATPAATPRCALAGVAASDPAIVATATKAANVFFISLALQKMALCVSAGFKMTHTLSSKPAVSPKSAQQSIESKRLVARKKGFFRPSRCLRDNRALCNEGERD